MAPGRAIGLAGALVASTGCLAFDTIEPTPTPTDNGPTITHPVPNSSQISINDDGQTQCSTTDDGVTLSVTASSPNAEPLSAVFYLNAYSLQKVPQALPQGGLEGLEIIPMNAQQSQANPGGAATSYQLTNVELYPLLFPASLVHSAAGGPNNVITVFVSDGFDTANFNPNSAPPPTLIGHTFAAYDWQLVADGFACDSFL